MVKRDSIDYGGRHVSRLNSMGDVDMPGYFTFKLLFK